MWIPYEIAYMQIECCDQLESQVEINQLQTHLCIACNSIVLKEENNKFKNEIDMAPKSFLSYLL